MTLGGEGDDVGECQQMQVPIVAAACPAQPLTAGFPGLRAGVRLTARSRCGRTRLAASRSFRGKLGIRHHPHRRPARRGPRLPVFGVLGVGEVDSRHDRLAAGNVDGVDAGRRYLDTTVDHDLTRPANDSRVCLVSLIRHTDDMS